LHGTASRCNVDVRPTTEVYYDLRSWDLNLFDWPELFTTLLTYLLHMGHALEIKVCVESVI